MKNSEESWKNKSKDEDFVSPDLPDIWAELEKRGHPIERSQIREFNLSGGKHYWVIDDPAKGTVRCASCPIRHGGTVDAYELARTRVEDGVIYLDDKATTKKPADFVLPVN